MTPSRSAAAAERLHPGSFEFVDIVINGAPLADTVPEPEFAGQLELTDAPRDLVGVGGRTGRRHPDTSRGAAPNVLRQRSEVHSRLVLAGGYGRLAEEVAIPMGLAANQVSARLLELWESHRAAVVRVGGSCEFGVCQLHRPADGAPHLPQQPCDRHGVVLKRTTTRGRKAAVWRAL